MDAIDLQRTVELDGASIRAQGHGSRQRFVFSGYALRFGVLSNPLREPGVNRGQPFRERIAGADAVSDTLAQDDIRFVLNHRMEQLLGRTSSGTLRLSADSGGVHVDSELPDTSYARDYAELVQRGDAREMSFRFYQPDYNWTRDGADTIGELRSFRIREVSALTVPPAYPETSASVAISAARAIADAEEAIRAGRVLSQQTLDELEAAIQALQSIIDRAEGSAEGTSADAQDGGRSIEILRRRLALRERAA